MNAKVKEFLKVIRSGPYTSIGSYPIFLLMADGETLSYKAARENVLQIARATRDENDKQWEFLAADVNWEDPDLYCAHSNERIESAYAEPEEKDRSL